MTALLPSPKRTRDTFVLPVPMYGCTAQILVPTDMTESEAEKVARVILAYSKITSYNSKPVTGPDR